MKLSLLSENLNITPEKIKLVYKLVQNLNYLCTFNVVQLDSFAKTPDSRVAVKEVVGRLIGIGKELTNNLNINDVEQLKRNIPAILKVSYDVLNWAGPILQKHIPDKVPGTLGNINTLYRQIVS